jgi:parallel beta-helix repeat protein
VRSGGEATFKYGPLIDVTHPDYGADPTGVTNSSSAIQAAIDVGGRIYFPTGTYLLTTAALTLASDLILEGDGDKSVLKLGANLDVLSLDGLDNVTIRNLKIDGQRATYTTTTNDGISSPANGTGSTNILIENVTITDMAGAGIIFLAQTGSHSEDIKIKNCRVLNSGAHGIICQDYVDDAVVDNCRVINFGLGVSDRPGITLGRTANNSQVLDCYVESDGNSLGTSAHGISIEGSHFSVVGNIVTGTVGYGIEVGFAKQGTVSGCEVYSTTRAGIAVAGDNTDVSENVTISGNTVVTPTNQGIYAFVANFGSNYHEFVNIIGNTIHNPSDSVVGIGIHVDHTRYGGISDNVISDAALSGIYLATCTDLDLEDNVFRNNNTEASASHDARIFQTGCSTIRINGFIDDPITAVASSGTGEDTLHTITIPQNFQESYKIIRVTAGGDKTNANDNKTIKFYFGASTFTFHAAANDENDWRVQVEILLRSSNSQYATWTGWNGTTITQGHEVWSEDLGAASKDLKITGECAHASDVITNRIWLVETF